MCCVIIHVGSSAYQGDVCNHCLVRCEKENSHAHITRVLPPCQRGPHLRGNCHYGIHAVLAQCIYCSELSLQIKEMESGEWHHIHTGHHMPQESQEYPNSCTVHTTGLCVTRSIGVHGMKSVGGEVGPEPDLIQCHSSKFVGCVRVREDFMFMQIPRMLKGEAVMMLTLRLQGKTCQSEASSPSIERWRSWLA